VAAAGSPGNLVNKTVSVGSTYTITGQTGTLGPGTSRATGTVSLSGRVDNGPPQLLRRAATTADGRFRLTIRLELRGKLDLRLATPDRRVLRVTLWVV
jgi:hypothetical protein